MAKRILFVLGCILILWSATSPTLALADAYVVIFSKTDQSLTGVSYSASGTGTIHHTICDLASGTGSYDVYQNSVLLSAVSPVPVSSAGTICFDTNSGGSFSVSQHAGGADVTPPSGSISINAGAASTNTTAVTLTLSATDSGSGMGTGAEMRFSNDNVTWSTSEPYATSKVWTLTTGDGTKTVYVRYKDAAGNWMSGAASDSITLVTVVPDTTPPSGSISISGGAVYSGTTSVTLTLSATDSGSGMGTGAEMRFSNDNVTWSTPEAYATTKAWTLSGGDGAKTVYARYKDAAGNWMSSSASDSIILDTTPPSGSMSINAGAASTNTTAVTLTLSATDSGSGMGSGAQMRFSNDNVTWSTPESYATTKSWTLSSGDGAKTVYVRYKDVAGNWTSSTVSDSITLDVSPPSTPAPPLIGQ